MFKKKHDDIESGPTYSFEIFPDNVSDGEHEFDGIKVSFSKPGWQWLIYEHNKERWPNEGRWARIHANGEGFPTRDAALVDLLKAAKILNNDQLEEST